ncbi:hypothetical protein AKJ58_00220 [candidate division MSBL1 archaeon SCGC-AAA385D11]|uniref:Gins51 C-terminal domain-containing protein n=1 Tax=candidate division MSBL1 archaeon SCGC-AAA385D11 TaxID=1698286 RepID=A0A133VPF4_9EURY|nr:hypothetical protein AKJ58_00220 [candidate division MSBL1 archaeon SCGC-AAA385D11]
MSDFGLGDIEKQWIEEKTSAKLAKLHEKFYERVADYVVGLSRELERSQDLRKELLREEFDWVIRMVQEIHFLRTLKAMELIVKGSLPSSLLEGERLRFEEIKDILKELREELLKTVVEGQAERPPHKKEKANVLLLISSELPQFVGDDMRRYGPFKSGDVVNLPKRSAEILRSHNLARRL